VVVARDAAFDETEYNGFPSKENEIFFPQARTFSSPGCAIKISHHFNIFTSKLLQVMS